jgi:translation initiation factor IF-1
MPEKLYDYANFIKLRLVISLYCSRQRTIMYAVEVQNGLYDTKRGRRKTGRISGAVKMATIWLIPKDAEKPIDGRTKQGKVKKYE